MSHTHHSYQLIPELWTAEQDGTLKEEITDIVLSGKVSYDEDRLIKKELMLKVSDPSRVRPYADHLVPFLTVRYDDGYEVRRQLGQYVAVPPKRSITTQQHHGFIEGRDLTWILQQKALTNVRNWGAGYPYTDAVGAMKMFAAEHLRLTYPLSSKTLGTILSWPVGTPYLEVMNDLLGAIGYYSLYTSNDGWLESKPYLGLIREANPSVTYDTVHPVNRIQVVRNVELEPLTDRICNHAIVIRDDPARGIMWAYKSNMSPDSPTSVPNLGMTITKTVRRNDIADIDTAIRMVHRMLDTGNSVYERLRLYTTPDVERGEHEVYELNIVSESGATITGKWLCTGWSIGFTPQDGPMEHQLARIDTGPFLDDLEG